MRGKLARFWCFEIPNMQLVACPVYNTCNRCWWSRQLHFCTLENCQNQPQGACNFDLVDPFYAADMVIPHWVAIEIIPWKEIKTAASHITWLQFSCPWTLHHDMVTHAMQNLTCPWESDKANGIVGGASPCFINSISKHSKRTINGGMQERVKTPIDGNETRELFGRKLFVVLGALFCRCLRDKMFYIDLYRKYECKEVSTQQQHGGTIVIHKPSICFQNGTKNTPIQSGVRQWNGVHCHQSTACN